MVVSTFSVLDKDDREKFFEKSFLLTDVKPNVVLRMTLLAISNVGIDFKPGTYNGGSISLETYFQTPEKSS